MVRPWLCRCALTHSQPSISSCGQRVQGPAENKHELSGHDALSLCDLRLPKAGLMFRLWQHL